MQEVQENLDHIWNNRKKLVMDIDVCAKWYPENWKSMTQLQLYGHFNMLFCTEMRFVRDRGNYFEQLLKSKILGSHLSENIAKELNEMTRKGQRKNMADEFFNIWFRQILKQIIKPERYVLGMR